MAHETYRNFKLIDKISQSTEEIRVVLPGTQALFAFQLTAVFADGFGRLSESLQSLHLVSIGFTALTTMFMIAPAAFHRIADSGNPTERFHAYSSGMLVLALFTLGVGMGFDLYVVATVVTDNREWAALGATAAFLIAFGLWYLFPLYLRRKEAAPN